MATINEMIAGKMPDEVGLFSASIATFVEEAMALAGFSDKVENDLSVLEKSLVADIVAEALIMPSMSHYKKAIKKAEGDQAGSVEFLDNKLDWLKMMKTILSESIATKKAKLLTSLNDTGVPMIFVS